MQSKTAKYTFRGMNRDVANSKHPLEFLYGANNIRFLTTDNIITGGIAFEKGNDLKITIPDITINTTTNVITYGTDTLVYKNGGEIDTDTTIPSSSTGQVIIGHTVTRDSIVLFTTDSLGMDCIWLVDNETYTLTLLYLRNLDFNIDYPIQALFNYENENIQKVYWVDGNNQIRFINLTHESIEGNDALIDIPASSINFVGIINFSQPIIQEVVGGGTHTSGMIQYGYNLYRLNNSQTKISPLSELVALDKGTNLGGGALNEVIGASPIINIDNIDTSYTHIRVYAIKYTSLNQTPSISLIEDRTLDNQTSITLYDDGSSIADVTLEEFLFLGSDPYTPKHIESKDNNLLLFNIQTKEFILPEELDCRAYGFPISDTTTEVNDNVVLLGGVPVGSSISVDNNYMVPYTHDAINLDYDSNKYQYNSTTLGGSGNFVEYEIVLGSFTDAEAAELKFFKDREIYRIGIQFYNRLGQVSLPQWVADFKSPSSNLQGSYGTLNVNLTAAFTAWLASYAFESEDDRPIGYKIIRADRTLADRSIICQGPITSMMVNSPRDSEGASLFTTTQKRSDSEIQPKIPNFLARTFQAITPLKANTHLEAMQFNGGTYNTEVQYDPSERKADTYQYTAMYQMYSPEIHFDSVSLNSSTRFNIIGGMNNADNAYWGQQRRISNQVVQIEGKAYNKLSPGAPGGSEIDINGDADDLLDRGLISDTNGSTPDEDVEFNQWYREFNTLSPSSSLLDYAIYGTPELTERGQGRTTYNNNSKYEYTNTLEGFLSDGEDDFNDDGTLDRAIISLNSYGAKCITFVADDGSDTDVLPHTRPLMETLYTNASIGNTNSILISELVKPANDIYLGSLYGGNTYEDKKRTTYLEIGEYKDITTTSVQIDSPGDTYVQDFQFLRIGKTDTEVYSPGVNQVTEIVSISVETSVDLKNRNDISISQWESRFQPRYDEYHEYNRVYSQQPTLVQTTDVDFNFKRINNFDTRIQATKTKVPNEAIDSWTDVLVNEVLDLDGKYGPINAVASFRDQIYTFQDNAFALVSVNPRVQTQGLDGIAIELATGGKLHDYKYISTKSGCLNKWGVIPTETGLYYLDGLNKRFYQFGQSLLPLSEVKGMHSYLETELNTAVLRNDNPLKGLGVSMGYDQKNNDVYMTYNNTWTLGFNEMLNEFTSFYAYNAPIYIYNKEKLLTVNPTGTDTVYETHAGDYNNFYGTNQDSSIILVANPEGDHECVFNNLEYKSEAIDNLGVEQRYTWENIRAYNEFQDSGVVNLANIRKLNRKYRLAIPRHANSRDRIRNNWTYIELSGSNLNNYFYLNHDIVLHYIANYIIIQ